MILDSVDQFDKYIHLHPLFPKALRFIKNIDFNNLEFGTKKILENDLFAIISNSSLKSENEFKLEAHNKYIDIQIPITKFERFGWNNRKDLLHPIGNFDETNDIIFYEDKPSTFLDLKPFNFLIFYPEDAHAPCIGNGDIIKIVIKVKVNP